MLSLHFLLLPVFGPMILLSPAALVFPPLTHMSESTMKKQKYVNPKTFKKGKTVKLKRSQHVNSILRDPLTAVFVVIP
jgi:hypothetical protein